MYELGVGVQPHGCSLHLTEEDLKLFVTSYFVSVEREAIDELASPDGDPFWCEIDMKTLDTIRAQSENHGIWFSGQPLLSP